MWHLLSEDVKRLCGEGVCHSLASVKRLGVAQQSVIRWSN